MTVAELINSATLQLPLNWQQAGYASYYSFLVHTGKNYLDQLKELDVIEVDGRTHYLGIPHTEVVYQAAWAVYQGVLHSVRLYLNNGSPSLAYNEFSRWMMRPSDWQPLGPAYTHLSHCTLRDQVFYRIRPDKEPLTEARELFHIPFDKRYLVRPQRFSISGFPCLYAASTPILALQELKAPEWLANQYVSKLRAAPTESVALLDLRNQLPEMRRQFNAMGRYDGRMINFLVTWPLVMATSVPTVYDVDKFREEYILPQLVLEWVSNSNRDNRPRRAGIAFSSSRAHREHPAPAFNIAVPVHHARPAGLCEMLTKQFEISAPLAVSELLTDQVDEMPKDQSKRLSSEIEARLADAPFIRLTSSYKPAP